MDQAGVLLFVVAPFDLAAFGGLRIAGIAQVGGVALVAQQRIADPLAGARKFRVRPEEGQRMVDRHDRQVLARHLGDQTAPKAGANADVGRLDRSARGVDALDRKSTRLNARTQCESRMPTSAYKKT